MLSFRDDDEPEKVIMTTRPVTAADLPILSALWHEKMLLQNTIADRERWQTRAETWMHMPTCGFFAYIDEDRPVGYILAWSQPAPAHIPEPLMTIINDMAIDAHGYHSGAGRELVRAVKTWAESRGAPQIVVMASRRYAAEQAFWRGLGASSWMEILWLKS